MLEKLSGLSRPLLSWGGEENVQARLSPGDPLYCRPGRRVRWCGTERCPWVRPVCTDYLVERVEGAGLEGDSQDVSVPGRLSS